MFRTLKRIFSKAPFVRGDLITNGHILAVVNMVFSTQDGKFKMVVSKHGFLWDSHKNIIDYCSMLDCNSEWYLIK